MAFRYSDAYTLLGISKVFRISTNTEVYTLECPGVLDIVETIEFRVQTRIEQVAI